VFPYQASANQKPLWSRIHLSGTAAKLQSDISTECVLVCNLKVTFKIMQEDFGGIDAWGLVNLLTLENTSYADTYGIHGYEYFGSSVGVSGRDILYSLL
jgi:hypothetical protein